MLSKVRQSHSYLDGHREITTPDSVRTATMGMAVHLGALYTDIPQGVSQD